VERRRRREEEERGGRRREEEEGGRRKEEGGRRKREEDGGGGRRREQERKREEKEEWRREEEAQGIALMSPELSPGGPENISPYTTYTRHTPSTTPVCGLRAPGLLRVFIEPGDDVLLGDLVRPLVSQRLAVEGAGALLAR